MIASRWAPIFSISFRSGPKILMPIGVRTPVVSISIRARIGMVQAFVTPGIRTFASISSINSSQEIRSGQIRLKIRFFSHSGRPARVPLLFMPPLRFGFQENRRFHHGEGGRIGGGFRAAGFSENSFHFGKALNQPVLELQDPLGFGDGDAREELWACKGSCLRSKEA